MTVPVRANVGSCLPPPSARASGRHFWQAVKVRSKLGPAGQSSPASPHVYIPGHSGSGEGWILREVASIGGAKRGNQDVNLPCVTVQRVDHRHRISGKIHEQFLARRVRLAHRRRLCRIVGRTTFVGHVASKRFQLPAAVFRPAGWSSGFRAPNGDQTFDAFRTVHIPSTFQLRRFAARSALNSFLSKDRSPGSPGAANGRECHRAARRDCRCQDAVQDGSPATAREAAYAAGAVRAPIRPQRRVACAECRNRRRSSAPCHCRLGVPFGRLRSGVMARNRFRHLGRDAP